MHKAIVDLSSLVKCTEKKIERLTLADEQNEEISELVLPFNVHKRSKMSFKKYILKLSSLDRDVVQ